MKKREIEKIKKAASDLDAEFKFVRKQAGFRLLKSIVFSGLVLLSWTFTMLLVLLIVADPEAGVLAFMEVNNILYKLYTVLSGIGVFVFLIEYIFKKKKNGVDKIIIKD